jgi:transcriptional regulator with XRE-family HTH domain
MARAALGWTLREFAEKSGINKNTIARYEAGEAILSDTLEKIETVLKEAGLVLIEPDGELGPGVRIRTDPNVASRESRHAKPEGKLKSARKRRRAQ